MTDIVANSSGGKRVGVEASATFRVVYDEEFFKGFETDENSEDPLETFQEDFSQEVKYLTGIMQTLLTLYSYNLISMPIASVYFDTEFISAETEDEEEEAEEEEVPADEEPAEEPTNNFGL